MARRDTPSNLRAHLPDGAVDLDPASLFRARGDNLGHGVGGHDLIPRAPRPVDPLARRLLVAEVAAEAHRTHETMAEAARTAARSADGSAGSRDVDLKEP